MTRIDMLFQTDTAPPVFETPEPWSLGEENMLLDAVEQYGFGNWLVFNMVYGIIEMAKGLLLSILKSSGYGFHWSLLEDKIGKHHFVYFREDIAGHVESRKAQGKSLFSSTTMVS